LTLCLDKKSNLSLAGLGLYGLVGFIDKLVWV